MNVALLWSETISHLWQTGVVLLVLAVAGWLLRRAPARFEHGLWTLALLKLAVPLSLGGMLWRWVRPESIPAGPTTWLDPRWITPGEPVQVAASSGWPAVLTAATVAWAVGAFVLLVRTVLAWRTATTIRRKSTELNLADRTRVEEALAGSAVPLDVVRFTEAPIGAAAVGILHGTILVSPAALELSPAELRALLEHEDSHRRRHDPARSLFRRVMVAFFFWFPPVWFIARRLHATAEFAADEHARRAVSSSHLANSLALMLQRGCVAVPAPAAAGITSRSLFTQRLKRLESPRRSSMPIHRIALATAAALTLVASLAPLSPTLAERLAAPKAPPAPTAVGGPQAVKAAPAPLATPVQSPAEAPTPVSEYDTPPAPQKVVAPRYPDFLRETEIVGTVLIQMKVLESGEPTEFTVVREVEDAPEFTEAALDAVKEWHFSPARKDGKPVAATVVLPIRFEPNPKSGEETDGC